MITALIFYVIFLICYSFFIWIVLWHAKEYLLPDDDSKWVVKIFITVSILLIVISLILFFMVPWDGIIEKAYDSIKTR